jgi:hypothetical protein
MEDLNVDKGIKAGAFGTVLAVVVNIFLPVDLDFVPSFIVAIFVVYVFRLETLKDGLVATFMIYIFNEGILNTVGLALLYFSNEPYPMITIDSWLILSPIIAAISTLVAGYIGIWLAKTRKPSPESLQPIPPEMQSV